MSSFISYFITTQAQDPGMLPLRYGGAWHTLKLIFYEEGFRGIFRGYSVGFTAVLFKYMSLKAINNYHVSIDS